MNANVDRRSGKRVAARVPVRVKGASDVELKAETRDISSNGVFLYTPSRLAEGCELELILILPPELANGKKSWVCCHAHVLRVEEHGKQFGVAAAIRRMDILPEIPT
jgi:hypothetical protein